MGLNIYAEHHYGDIEIFTGSYGGFSEFRRAIGRAAGGKYRGWPEGPRIGHVEAWFGEWNLREPEDPLDVLMYHADTEGEIPVRYLVPLADRLVTLLPHFEDEYIADQVKEMIEGLRLAAAANSPALFH